MSILTFCETLWQDLRFGARTLGRHPGFAAVAVLTLGLGIGANAAIFSVVNTVLLRPLPWAEPDRAIMIWSRWISFDKTWVSSGEVMDYRRRAATLEQVAAWSDGQVNITGDGDPERVTAGEVTANTFSTLGVSPALGRTFTAQEDVPNGPRLVVLGHTLWSRRYASDPHIVGRSVLIDGDPFEVVGVMPDGFVLPTDFQNPEPTQMWMPLRLDPASTDHGSHGLYAAARLKPGATVSQAAAELHGIAMAMTNEGLYPRQMQFDTLALSLTDEVVGTVRRAIVLLFGAVGFLLLIACANVANLLLARAEARQREIAVRSALGAGGFRVVRQLLTESLVLATISAALGLALAFGGVRFLAWWNPANIPRVSGVTLDLRVLVFTAIVALITSIVFSLAPALRALRVDLTDSLKDGSQSSSSGGARQRFRNTLVIVEMALAVVLLTGAGLMLRTLWSLQRVDLGFDASNVLTMRLSLPQASYRTPEEVVGFYQRLLERVRSTPGVRTAGAVRALPLASTIGDFGLQVEGYVPPPGSGAKGDWEIATDGYLEALGERLVRGRSIAPSDATDGMLVALINEEMAHRSVGNPIRAMNLVVKASGDPLSLVGPIRQEIRALDPSLPIADVRTMADVVGTTLSTPRFTGVLLGVFAALALALSAIGIYGVLSYVVSRRTREIGIRLAIGASRRQVLAMVLRNGLVLSLAGIVLGLVAAALTTRLMSTLLHGVTPGDPATFAVVGIGLSGVAALASLIPAWRATRVDPVVALKTE
jgi:putative ABC transport system permease protein